MALHQDVARHSAWHSSSDVGAGPVASGPSRRYPQLSDAQKLEAPHLVRLGLGLG